jgi:hypothetical protein
MSIKNCNIICWNVRGLNDGAKRASVRNQIISSGATVVCLQETKIGNWTHTLITETVGGDLAQNVVVLPSAGASGGDTASCFRALLQTGESTPDAKLSFGNTYNVG